jgi:hypothetical protein
MGIKPELIDSETVAGVHHVFDVKDAEKHGLEKAVILANFKYWIKSNLANNRNIYAGMCWTYNTVEALSELFPYINATKIGRILRAMEKDGVILSCKRSDIEPDCSTYIQTKAYTVPALFKTVHATSVDDKKPEKKSQVIDSNHIANLQYGECNSAEWNNQNCTMEGADLQHVKDINTDINTDIKLKDSYVTENPSQANQKNKSIKFTEDDHRFAVWMFDQIKKVIPLEKKPNFDSWADDIRIMREQDKRTLHQAAKIFKWANLDSFWCKNLRSPKKLRTHYGRIHAEMCKNSNVQADNLNKINQSTTYQRKSLDDLGL